MTSNAVPPSVTPPSPLEWQESVFSITGITKASQAVVTCPAYAFTQADEGITSVMFLQVKGMLPINGLPGIIQEVIDDTHFSVNINTTFMPTYVSGGVISILTGQPPVETQGFQTFNTPLQNIANTL